MIDVLNAVLPVFMLILLGYGLKHYAFITKSGWEGLERLTYYVFLPALLFHSFAGQPLANGHVLKTAVIIILLIFTAVALVAFFVGREVLRLENKTFASFFQGSIRFNNYIGLSLVAALFGTTGVNAYGVIVLLAIPLANFLTLAVMAHYADERAFSLKRVTRQTVLNPLVLATIAGFIASLIPIAFPMGKSLIGALASGALPAGVLGIGAALSLKNVKQAWKSVVGSCFVKLIVFPALILVLMLFYDLPSPWWQVLMIFSATPCATSCYILSKHMNADADAMASISAVMTLASALTMTLWMYGMILWRG